MHHLVPALLLIVGIIHLLPLSGVFGASQLSALYGIAFDEPNLEILMRHRAVLFGLLGSFLVYAAFRPGLRVLALLAALASVSSFLWFAWSAGGYNALIGRVVMADRVALACLVVALAGRVLAKRWGNAATGYSGETPSATRKRATML